MDWTGFGLVTFSPSLEPSSLGVGDLPLIPREDTVLEYRRVSRLRGDLLLTSQGGTVVYSTHNTGVL